MRPGSQRALVGERVSGVGLDWDVSGIGDFNGDGTDDILLFKAETEQLIQFEMVDGARTAKGITHLDGVREVAGVGDYNADGTDDILLRHTGNGSLSQLQMTDGAASPLDFITGLSSDWDVIA